MLSRSRKNTVSLDLCWVPSHLGVWKGEGRPVSLLQGNADMKAKRISRCLTWRAQLQNGCRKEDKVAELRKQEQIGSGQKDRGHTAGVNCSLLLLWHKAKSVSAVVTGHQGLMWLKLTPFPSFYLQGSMKLNSCFRISLRVNFQIRYHAEGNFSIKTNKMHYLHEQVSIYQYSGFITRHGNNRSVELLTINFSP